MAQRLLLSCSRLADGPLWLLLLLSCLLIDPGGRAASTARVGLVLGAVNLLIYWALKRGTRRARPFHDCSDIVACVRAADRFSFPSGHTLHAVSFALLLSAAWPASAPLLWSFAVLVALSRVVLGVHYPSDVLVGAALGAGTAYLARSFL